MNAKITAICNLKGGVGKSVTAVNLGTGLAREGKKVLIVDTDPQDPLTASLGYNPDKIDVTLSTLMSEIIMDELPTPGVSINRHETEQVDLVPANIELGEKNGFAATADAQKMA